MKILKIKSTFENYQRLSMAFQLLSTKSQQSNPLSEMNNNVKSLTVIRMIQNAFRCRTRLQTVKRVLPRRASCFILVRISKILAIIRRRLPISFIFRNNTIRNRSTFRTWILIFLWNLWRMIAKKARKLIVKTRISRRGKSTLQMKKPNFMWKIHSRTPSKSTTHNKNQIQKAHYLKKA